MEILNVCIHHTFRFNFENPDNSIIYFTIPAFDGEIVYPINRIKNITFEPVIYNSKTTGAGFAIEIDSKDNPGKIIKEIKAEIDSVFNSYHPAVCNELTFPHLLTLKIDKDVKRFPPIIIPVIYEIAEFSYDTYTLYDINNTYTNGFSYNPSLYAFASENENKNENETAIIDEKSYLINAHVLLPKHRLLSLKNNQLHGAELKKSPVDERFPFLNGQQMKLLNWDTVLKGPAANSTEQAIEFLYFADIEICSQLIKVVEQNKRF